MASRNFHEIWKKNKRIELITQTEEADCGFAALAMVLNFHGAETEVSELRRRYPYFAVRPVLPQDLMEIAAEHNFVCQPLKIDGNSIDSLALPAVLLWEKGHYVLLASYGKNRFEIYDPYKGHRIISGEEFAQKFAEIAVEIVPTKPLATEETKKILKLSTLVTQVDGLAKSFFLLMIVFVAIFALSFVIPYYSIIVMDDGINARDTDLITSAFAAIFIVIVLKTVVEYLRGMILYYMGGQFMMQTSRNIIRHVLRLPMSFFERRHASEILSRLDATDEIKRILTNDLAKTVIDAVILSSNFILLMAYSWQLSSIVLATSAITCSYRFYVMRTYLDSTADMFATDAKEQATLTETLRGMQSVKLYGIEKERFKIWDQLFSHKLNRSLNSQKLNNYWEGLERVINMSQDVIILFVGASLVLTDKVTVGVLVAFIGYKDKFVPKFAEMMTQVMSFRTLSVHLERLSDIMIQETEPTVSSISRVELSGAFALKDICFRYSAKDPLLFNGLNISLEPGQSIAITGPSGCGKSTLMKIMLGLIDPTSGDVVTDGYNIRKIQQNYREHIATVMQDDCILSGTIQENITFFNNDPDVEWMKEAAALACIHDDIAKMPMGYQSLISDYNNTISGGQKQRILIARAIYRRPKIMFMDEATSALDVTNEAKVNEAIRGLGVTRIIIAHRMETINSADQVYTLAGGKLTPRGKYSEADLQDAS